MKELDLRSLRCPQPVLELQKVFRSLPVDECWLVRCTDPTTLKDVPLWCRQKGVIVIEIRQLALEIQFVLNRAPSIE